jgi:hypothetical protein
VFLAKLFAWQRRRARAHGIADPHAGAITFVQRFDSLLNLNCHAHAVLPDGVFAAGPDGAVQFHPLPPPWEDDVARVLGQVARAIHRLVERHLAQRGDAEPLDLLAAEQAQAITALPWPDRPPPPKPTSRRSAFLDGYSLHADRFIDANDREDLEQLCRYGTRSPIANARLSCDPTGRVILSLKRLPQASLARRSHRTHVHPDRFPPPLGDPDPTTAPSSHSLPRGFAPHHHLRAAIVHAAAADQPHPAPRRRLPWADLLKRVFAVDVLVCDTCGGSMRILAVLPAGEASRAILEHLGLPTKPPPCTRAPPGRRLTAPD